MDSTIHIKSLFPAQSFSYADWLHAFSNFQLVACWLHGKCKDSILSSLLQNILLSRLQKRFTSKFVKLQTSMLIYCFTRHLMFYCCSAHVVFWITRHLNNPVLLGTWSLDHSALDVTRHLNTWFTRHLITLGTWTSLVHSALGITRHLNTLFTRHLTSLGTWSCWIIRHLNKTELLGTLCDSAPSMCSACIYKIG